MEESYEKIAIQWYPGHMTKAARMIGENMRLVDAVCEILDARIPMASRNPDVERLAGEKPHLLILNRADLADPEITARWREFFRREGYTVLETDARSGKGVRQLPNALREVLKDKIAALTEKGQANRPLRIMILGIPNVGKSTLINQLAGRRAAVAGDKPGVTRGKQWITLPNGILLLDTPGILWPKFDSQEVGEMLAITNAIKADVLDKETLGANFMLRLRDYYPQALTERYKFTPDPEANGFELLEEAAKKRGFLVSRGEYDIERMANTLLGEYHDGKLGRLSLEQPDEGSLGKGE